MLDPRLKEWLSKGYAKIGDISYSIALNMRKGKNQVTSTRNLYEQGIKMSVILKVLNRHISFDEVTGLPTLWRITEEQVNKFLKCLIELGELDKYPIVPTLFPATKPIIVNKGAPGGQGLQGNNGSNAEIIVQLATGEGQLKLTTTVVGLIKTYELSLVNYIVEKLTAVIQGSRVFEVGTVQNFSILITSTKGTEAIVTLICTDGPINTILQPYVDLVQLNGVTQPSLISLPLTNQSITKTYQFNVNDGKTTVTASDTVSFYNPFLYGPSAVTGINPYTALTKKITGKANEIFTFNDTDKYFYICYPASYGSLVSIKDPNGFEALGAFTVTTENVTSSGLTNNWTLSYKVYRTTIKTSVVNGNYQIFF
jgi:hypothetical protein